MSRPSSAQNVLDYDDLLLYWAQMMAEPALADDVGGRFDHVLVDEYQDTNRLQASILLALKPDGRGLTVVGDDAQSIYSFRAATVRNILDFPGQFSAAGRRSSRSTATTARPQPILAAANAVIGLARGALHQEPVDRAQSAAAAAARDGARRGRPGALRRRARCSRTARPASR